MDVAWFSELPVGPIVLERPLSVAIEFDASGDLEPRSLKPEIQTTSPSEERKHRERSTLPRPRLVGV